MNTVVILFIIFAVAGLSFHKSKILTTVIFFFIWTMAWTDLQPDYYNYLQMYNYEEADDYGYLLLMIIFKHWGFDYFDFRLVLLAVGWTIYAWFIIKYAKKCSLVAALYMCTVSFYDTVQNRNFFGFALCLIGISFLIEKNNFKSKILFILMVLTAASIHITCCFFLLFLIFDKNFLSKASMPLKVGISVALLLVLYYYYAEIESKIAAYDVGVSTTTKLLLILLFIANFLFIKYSSSFRTSQKVLQKFNKAQEIYSISPNKNIVFYNMALFVLLPASIMSLNALRFYRYMEILNLCYITDRLNAKTAFHRILLTIAILVYAASFGLVSYLMHSTSYLSVVLPPFLDNQFYL